MPNFNKKIIKRLFTGFLFSSAIFLSNFSFNISNQMVDEHTHVHHHHHKHEANNLEPRVYLNTNSSVNEQEYSSFNILGENFSCTGIELTLHYDSNLFDAPSYLYDNLNCDTNNGDFFTYNCSKIGEIKVTYLFKQNKEINTSLCSFSMRAKEVASDTKTYLDLTVGNVIDANNSHIDVKSESNFISILNYESSETKPSEIVNHSSRLNKTNFNIGDTVIYSLGKTDGANYTSAEIEITYDSSLLSYENITYKPVLDGAVIDINAKYNGVIYITFIANKNVEYYNDLFDINFKVLKDTEISSTIITKFNTIGGSIFNKIISPKLDSFFSISKKPVVEKTPSIYVNDQNVFSADSFSVDLLIDEKSNLGAADITISFDVKIVKFIDGAVNKINGVYSGLNLKDIGLGKIYLSVLSTSGIKTAAKLATINLKAINSNYTGTSFINVSAVNVTDRLTNPINLEFKNGKITFDGHTHEYGQWVVTKQETCTEDGLEERVCSICGHKEIRVRKALNHNFTEWTQTKAPTCTEKGEEKRTCLICGKTEIRIIQNLGHNFDTEWTIDKEPTCTEPGSKSHHCLTCGEKTDITEIPALGHKEKVRIENKIEATCTKDGSYDEVTYCEVCGEIIKTEHKIIKATGHNWSEWTQTKAPSCTENGEEKRTCSVCGEVETRVVQNLGHNFDTEWTIDKEPTCTEPGSKSHHCLTCGKKTDITEIPALGHKEKVRIENKIEATCTKDGSYDEVTYCEVCGEIIKTEHKIIKATGHNWSEWTQTKAPNCNENGEEKRTCSVCGEVETRVINKLDHKSATRIENKIEPTCTQKGSYDLVTYCSECGTIIKTEHKIIEAKGHNFDTEWTIDKEPTCIEPGSKSHHCLTCGEKTDITEIPALGHKEKVRIEIKIEATCTKDGSYDEVTYCEVCGEIIKTEHKIIKATGHNWSEWMQIKAPSCTENGEEKRTCSICGEVETRVINKLDHKSATRIENKIEPTCTQKGSYDLVTYCSECGTIIKTEHKIIEATGHNFDTEWTIDKEPTCTEPGSKSHHCLTCGEKTDITEIPALGHKEKVRIENKIEATCTKDGSYDEVTYCEVCNEIIKTEHKIIKATGHNWSEWMQIKAPSCTENGEEKRTCSICGEVETRVINKLDHKSATRIENKIDPTCTQKGSYDLVTYCSECGTIIKTEHKIIEATGHNFDTEWTVNKEPTCTEPGSKSHHCLICGEKTDITEIPALGHKEKVRIENKIEATCTKDGSYDEVTYCEVCGEIIQTDHKIIKATGHKNGHWIVTEEATTESEGIESYICDRCGEVIETRVIPKLVNNNNSSVIYIVLGGILALSLLIAVPIIISKKIKK